MGDLGEEAGLELGCVEGGVDFLDGGGEEGDVF